jgi:hypothetical protein
MRVSADGSRSLYAPAPAPLLQRHSPPNISGSAFVMIYVIAGSRQESFFGAIMRPSFDAAVAREESQNGKN